jgi:hypothetical protein
MFCLGLMWLCFFPQPTGVCAMPRLSLEAVDVRRLPDLGLLFSVQDSAGEAVAGLRAEDFRLLVDGQLVEGLGIVPLAGQAERAVVFVLEASEHLRGPAFFAVRNLVADLGDRLAPRDRAALVLVTGAVTVATELTDDRARLKRALAEIGVAGTAVSLNSALNEALRLLRAAPESARAIVLFASGAGVVDEPLRAEVLSTARELRIPVHVFAAALQFEDPALPAFAGGTGGRFYPEPLGSNAAELARRALSGGSGRYRASVHLPGALDGRPRHAVVEVSTLSETASAEFSFLMTPYSGVSEKAIVDHARRSRARQSWWVVYFGAIAGGVVLALLRDWLGVGSAIARLLMLGLGLVTGAFLGFVLSRLDAP